MAKTRSFRAPAAKDIGPPPDAVEESIVVKPKRRRATTTGSTHPPPTKISRTESPPPDTASAPALFNTNSEDDNAPSDGEDIPQLGLLETETTPEARYSIRHHRDDIAAHPGLMAGLGKRTQAGITAEAAEKRREKDLAQEEKREVQREKVVREKTGARVTAEMLDEYTALRIEEESYLKENHSQSQNIGDKLKIKLPASSRRPMDSRDATNGGSDLPSSRSNVAGRSQTVSTPNIETRSRDETYIGKGKSSQMVDDLDNENSDESDFDDEVKLTTAEKKKWRAQKLRNTISAARGTDGSGEGAAKKASGSKLNERKYVQRLVLRVILKNVDITYLKEHDASHNRLKTPNNPSSSTSVHHRLHSRKSNEGIGGFTDADVAEGSGKKRKFKTGNRNERGSRVLVRPDSDDDAPSDHPDSPGHAIFKVVRAPSGKPRVPRERGINACPEWSYTLVDNIFASTAINYYGGVDMPFELDQVGSSPESEFMSLLQGIIDLVSPEQHYEVSRSCAIYARVRQRVHTWISTFHSSSNSFIQAKISREKLTTAKVQQWIGSASRGDGEAFWGEAATSETEASGAFESAHILNSFAGHLRAIEGSVLNDLITEQDVPPLGAMTLAACAVQLSFMKFSSGKFVAAEAFSQANTRIMFPTHQASAMRICSKTTRLDRFLTKAREFVKTGRKTASANSAPISMLHAPVIMDRSSEPPMLNSDDGS
ncbi:hypothetical protein EUX98_g4592 [Antrodiella citrinella]|uniref:Uncharacterized protein n=1 Tax=Antrodiella citrinella TaxID=2447956 RepID=A0A4S4MTL4_9APHY|nr:hypothetical protein EUX98_g4592 [Antrodiella citrinella]